MAIIKVQRLLWCSSQSANAPFHTQGTGKF